MSGQNADANLAKKFAMAKKELLNELRKQPQLKGMPSLEELKEMLRKKVEQCKCKNDF
ncbi:unnamed protein product [Anisakis simplex]|uniref:GTP-binding protein n=1 Tax=Anisakis simplex TaxID=6269 RepID=A0A0M3JLJ2_ANISI|nr:unnamed protein product [Anisakis simplex]